MLRLRGLATSTILGSVAFALAGIPAAARANQNLNPEELLNLSLEQLSNIEVTSVSKRSEKASEAAAAIYVITQDDIRRSGMTTIPELLRMVPGLDVAQAGAHEWAVSSRGWNDEFANKLLVMIDGRSVYTPIFSGVFWDTQDVILQDIERIEVIRGPGATLWGANAVNGVINIITKTAADTQGGLLSQSVGNQVNSLTSARYGMKIGEDAHVRVYAKYDDYSDASTLTDTNRNDQWNKSQAGFRSDWKQGETQSFTLQGDIYRAGESYVFTLPLPDAPFASVTPDRELDKGGNILGRWNNRLTSDSDLTVQLYYDNASRSNVFYAATTQTFDLDFQHALTPWEGHELVWGGGYRLVKNDTTPTPYIAFTPTARSDNLFSAFVQDQFALVPESVFLTLGSKFEVNDYTGFEAQPSARFSWLINDRQMLWGSVSRAIHTPNITTDDIQIIAAVLAPSTLAATVGNKGTESEELTAYELGYRIQPTKNSSLDFAGFYNDYRRLFIGTLGGAPIGPITTPIGANYFLVPASAVSSGTAHSWGIETSAKWNPYASVELAAGYTFHRFEFDQPDPFGFPFDGKSPQHQFNIRSTVQLPHDVEWNTSLYFVDRLPYIYPLSSTNVDAYYRLDMRLAWQPVENLEVALVGQNLLDPSHPEFPGFLYQNSAQIPRSVYGNITWKF